MIKRGKLKNKNIKKAGIIAITLVLIITMVGCGKKETVQKQGKELQDNKSPEQIEKDIALAEEEKAEWEEERSAEEDMERKQEEFQERYDKKKYEIENEEAMEPKEESEWDRVRRVYTEASEKYKNKDLQEFEIAAITNLPEPPTKSVTYHDWKVDLNNYKIKDNFTKDEIYDHFENRNLEYEHRLEFIEVEVELTLENKAEVARPFLPVSRKDGNWYNDGYGFQIMPEGEDSNMTGMKTYYTGGKSNLMNQIVDHDFETPRLFEPNQPETVKVAFLLTAPRQMRAENISFRLLRYQSGKPMEIEMGRLAEIFN